MRTWRSQLLPLVVSLTLGLLTGAAALSVVGIFNEVLHWDLFGPKVEAALWGVFSSCLALAGIGVAMTVVAGIRSIARSFERLEDQRAGAPPRSEVTLRRHLQLASAVSGVFLLVIVALSTANYAIRSHRSGVFKRLASEQANALSPRLATLTQVPARGFSPQSMVEIELALRALEQLSFVQHVMVYRSDPRDLGTLLVYQPPYQGSRERQHFRSQIAVKARDRQISRVLAGDTGVLDGLNRDEVWHWYHLVSSTDGSPTALIEMVGNPAENYREYPLGS